jgi:YHS domain-containing protein
MAPPPIPCQSLNPGDKTDDISPTKKNMIMSPSKTEAIDPICGMTVDTDTALHTERDGTMFYFCSEHCQEKFLSASVDAKPDKKSGDCCCD